LLTLCRLFADSLSIFTRDMADILLLRLLGPVQVEREGEPARGFRSRKAMALLGYLAVQNKPVSREHLADLFWGDKSETRGRANLSWTLNRISSQLPDCLQADLHTVQFQRTVPSATAASLVSGRPLCRLDLDVFAELEAQGEPASLAAAVQLYRGEFLEGLYLDDCAEFELWLVKERERWRQRAVSALGDLIAHYSQRGEYKQSLQFAQRLLALQPWREETHQQVMHLLAYTGQRSAALAQYEACRRILVEELEVEPSAETVRLYERIRDEKLDIPASSPTIPALPSFLLQEEEPGDSPIFVARQRELAQLDRFLDEALSGQGRVIFVTGDAGQGKTALLQEFAQRAQEAHPDLVMADGSGNAYTGSGDPYLIFRELLRLLTGDVEARWAAGAMPREQARRLWHVLPLTVQALVEVGPDLIGTFVLGSALLRRVETAQQATSGRTSWLPQLNQIAKHEAAARSSFYQSDLFEQYVRVLGALARRHPLLLMMDDLQWADTGSTNLLFHLGRQIEGNRILVVGAFRPAEVALGRGGERHPLESVVNELKRRLGDVELDLSRAEGRQFIDALLDAEPNRLGAPFRDALYRQTGGHPLFTIELLRGMQERGDLVLDDGERWSEGPMLDWETLPVRVEAVIAERIGRLADPLQQVLRVACVEGEAFTAEVVARLQGVTEQEMVKCLSRVLNREHHLVHAQGLQQLGMGRLSRYQFRHILFQRYLYNSLDTVERAHLHGRVGTTLEALYAEAGEDTVAAAGQLAWHFQEAGIAAKAVDYLHQAGDGARGLYALDQAIGYYQHALELLQERGAQEQMARTLMKLGLTHHLAFDFERARMAYEEGFDLWQQVGEPLPAGPSLSAKCTLKVDWPFLPSSLDPALAADADSAGVVDQLFSGLVQLGPALTVVPDVARSWEVSEGGRRYVFHLRDGAQWSDGTPVRAQDFEYAWKRVLEPDTASPTAELLYDVKGARAFHQGDKDAGGIGVRAVDEVTLAVELERPVGYFLYLLAHNAYFPVPRHVLETGGEVWTKPENAITNGPFCLEAWNRQGTLTLSRNPTYHGRFTGNVERVELHSISDIPARLEAYEMDELDALFLWSPSEERERARQQHAGEYITAPLLATTYVGFDVSRPPFDDPRVRRAFVLAADKEKFADVVMQGYAFPATGGFVPPGMPGHSAGVGLPHDLDQARSLLAEAGYPGGCQFPAVELLSDEVLSKHLATQWQEDLGVGITWSRKDWEEVLERMENDPPHIYFGAWYADYPDPDNFLRVCDGIRWTRWQNDIYSRLVEEARRVVDQQERMKMYLQADSMLVGEAVIMPVIYWRSHLLVKPWIKRFPTSAVKWWFLKDVIVEPH
jgi:ABC-type oligopeptide transport system substrate-binding subunit/DNA-binding SARP family transcriptional activator